MKLKGFSIIEVLISVAIIALIMTAVISNFRSGEWRNQLSLAAANVASELRKAQTMVSAGQPTQVCMVAAVMTGICEDDPAGCGGTCVEHVPYGGYGLVFVEDSETITFFANTDATDDFDKIDEKVRDLKISPTGRVKIAGISTDTTGTINQLQIIFIPPTNVIKFGGPDVFGSPNEATITISHLSSGEKREIVINKISGRIDAEP